MIVRVFLFSVFTVLIGCSFSDSHQDLRDFIAENKRRPPGKIQEPPKLVPYEAYSYDAYSLRSPFDRPLSALAQQQITESSDNVKPDFSRLKEPLEQYDLSSLSMVGTLTQRGELWALIRDPDGSIERVKEGNFLGRNHGKITGLSDNTIDLLEIVANGEGWLERPNVLELKIKESN